MPSTVQWAALAGRQVDHAPNIAAYTRKRDLMISILSATFQIGSPDGAFYLWAKAPAGMTGTRFIEQAIANNRLIISGAV